MCLLFLCVYAEFLAMEHEQKKISDLHDIVVDKVDKANNPPSIIQLVYTAFLERMASKKGVQMSSPQQAVHQIESELDKHIAALKDGDPEMYAAIMNFKLQAELNGKTQQEIKEFIETNLDKLSSINMYQHLYSAQAAKIESDKKKDYQLHDVLDNKELVNESTLYHTLLYRSAAIACGKEEVEKEVEKAKGCVDDWLKKIKEDHPIAYAILAQAYEEAKNNNLNQQDAGTHLLNAVNQLTNVDSLLLPMKDIQSAHQKTTIWKQAGGIIAAVVGIFSTISGSTGGILGGLFATKNATVIACTLGECIALMNVTIG